MYVALSFMIFGIIAGRILRGKINVIVLRKCTMAAIFLLLFLLGASIGGNEKLFDALPRLGADAAILTFFCAGGSITAAVLLKFLLPDINSHGVELNKSKDANAR